MFEELLLPVASFSTRKVTIGHTRWGHPEDWYSITKLKDVWAWRPTGKFYNNIDSTHRAYLIKESKKYFPTLKKARQHIDTVGKQLLPEIFQEGFKQKLIHNPNSYYKVTNSIYDWDGLCPLLIRKPIITASTTWILSASSCYPETYNLQKISALFYQQYATKPEAIKNVYHTIAENLDKLYDTTEIYPQTHQSLRTGDFSILNNNFKELWWVYFIKPDVDLQNIFS